MVKLETYENNAKLRIKTDYTLNIWSFHLQFFIAYYPFKFWNLPFFLDVRNGNTSTSV